MSGVRRTGEVELLMFRLSGSELDGVFSHLVSPYTLLEKVDFDIIARREFLERTRSFHRRA